MGLLTGLVNRGKEKHGAEVMDYLFQGERVISTYGLLIDFAALTTERLLFVDKTLISKRSFVVSVPYSKVESVAIEKDRRLAFTNKIIIYTKKREFSLNFIKGTSVLEFYHALCANACLASNYNQSDQLR